MRTFLLLGIMIVSCPTAFGQEHFPITKSWETINTASFEGDYKWAYVYGDYVNNKDPIDSFDKIGHPMFGIKRDIHNNKLVFGIFFYGLKSNFYVPTYKQIFTEIRYNGDPEHDVFLVNDLTDDGNSVYCLLSYRTYSEALFDPEWGEKASNYIIGRLKKHQMVFMKIPVRDENDEVHYLSLSFSLKNSSNAINEMLKE